MRKPSEIDYMIIALSREIRKNEAVFNGVNSILPMVAIAVAKHLNQVPFTYINIAGGIDVEPNELPRSTSSAALLKGTACVFPNDEFYDLCTRGKVDLVYLGAAQVDSQGNTNVSAIGPYESPKVRLPGGGGAAVLMPTAKRVVIWRAEHTTRSFPSQLDFTTAKGNVDAVITPLCVFRRIDGLLKVESIYPTTTIEEIRERTGFQVLTAPNLDVLEISNAELEAIDRVDPNQVRFLDWGHK